MSARPVAQRSVPARLRCLAASVGRPPESLMTSCRRRVGRDGHVGVDGAVSVVRNGATNLLPDGDHRRRHGFVMRTTAGAGRTTRDGQRVTCGGQRVTCGGQRVTYGGQRVTCGGQRETCGGQRVTYGSQRVTYGGQRVTYGGQRVINGGQRVAYGGPRVINGRRVRYGGYG